MNTSAPSGEQIASAVDEITEALTADRAGDARAIELVGTALADRLRPYSPDVVVVRDNVDDSVLAHVISRELGIPTVRIYEGAGLLSPSPHPAPGGRAVLLAVSWQDRAVLPALRLLLANAQVDVVAVGAALPAAGPTTGDAGSIPFVTAG